jgi:hypothetical protein
MPPPSALSGPAGRGNARRRGSSLQRSSRAFHGNGPLVEPRLNLVRSWELVTVVFDKQDMELRVVRTIRRDDGLQLDGTAEITVLGALPYSRARRSRRSQH